MTGSRGKWNFLRRYSPLGTGRRGYTGDGILRRARARICIYAETDGEMHSSERLHAVRATILRLLSPSDRDTHAVRDALRYSGRR